MRVRLKDFTEERLSVDPGRVFVAAAGSVRLGALMSPAPQDATGLALGPADSDDFTNQLAARWNACADALDLAEHGEQFTTFASQLTAIRDILRRAVHREG